MSPLRSRSLKRQAADTEKGVRPFSTVQRAAPLKSAKPLKAVNPERQKKAKQRAAKKHRAYMASETRQIVEARSRGRCEFSEFVKVPTRAWPDSEVEYRCTAPATDHHHKTYARFGGRELPSDVTHVCKAHHDFLESLKPAGNRYTRSRSTR